MSYPGYGAGGPSGPSGGQDPANIRPGGPGDPTNAQPGGQGDPTRSGSGATPGPGPGYSAPPAGYGASPAAGYPSPNPGYSGPVPGYSGPATGYPGPGAPAPPAGGFPPAPGPPGTPGQFGPGGPPPGLRHARLIAIAAVVLVVIGAAALVFAFTRHSGSSHHEGGGGASPPPTVASSTQLGTPSSSGPTPVVSIQDAKNIAVGYFTAINAQNPSQGEALICSSKAAGWRTSATSSTGDLKYMFQSYSYASSQVQTEQVLVTYNFTAISRADKSVIRGQITFTVINENGAKICGEKVGT